MSEMRLKKGMFGAGCCATGSAEERAVQGLRQGTVMFMLPASWLAVGPCFKQSSCADQP